MSRDASGNYSLPTGNPVTSGTLVESVWANQTMADIAAEITDSLSRSGNGGMLAPFRFANGLVTAPSLAFTSDVLTGWYLANSGDMRAVTGGVDRVRITSAGIEVRVLGVFELLEPLPPLPPPSVPSGAVMVFKQAAAPSGWTQDTSVDDAAFRLVSGVGGATVAGLSFADTFDIVNITGTSGSTSATGAITVNAHVLTEAELPPHTHTYLEVKNDGTRQVGSGDAVGGPTGDSKATGSSGGGVGHPHTGTFSGVGHTHALSSGTVNLSVKYVDLIACVKD